MVKVVCLRQPPSTFGALKQAQCGKGSSSLTGFAGVGREHFLEGGKIAGELINRNEAVPSEIVSRSVILLAEAADVFAAPRLHAGSWGMEA